jgi:hypothetical protein
MEYFAGIFDAEGTLSLQKNGAFPISLEMANPDIPYLFYENFDGSVYTRQRKDRKQTWTWKINSVNEQAINFLKSIHPYSLVKKEQIWFLLCYLDLSRFERRGMRLSFCEEIRQEKQPYSLEETKKFTEKLTTNTAFFKWFAGFIDGDGNFVCNQYTDKRNSKKYFGRQISFSTIDSRVINFLSPWNGTVVVCPRNKNTLYKWSPLRKDERWICESILPFLRVKNKQCELFLEFLDCKNDVRKFEIIDHIKHLNSL